MLKIKMYDDESMKEEEALYVNLNYFFKLMEVFLWEMLKPGSAENLEKDQN